MTLPVNIESLIDGRVVESDRIEFKKGWNHVSIPCHKDFACKELMIDEEGHIRDRKLTIATANDIRKQIFSLIVENNRITRRELSESIGINQSAIQKHIEALINNGNIKREGKTRASYFIVLKDF